MRLRKNSEKTEMLLLLLYGFFYRIKLQKMNFELRFWAIKKALKNPQNQLVRPIMPSRGLSVSKDAFIIFLLNKISLL